MANRLTMAVSDSIYTLLARGCSRRLIARMLGIDRGTVRRYAELASNPAGAPPGSEQPEPGAHPNTAGAPSGLPGIVPPDNLHIPSNPATAPPGSVGMSAPIQPSTCEPFRDLILARLEQALTAQRSWQDLVSEHGFPAQYHSVRRSPTAMAPSNMRLAFPMEV